MYEEMGKLLGRGFEVWKHNLNLCIPFLLTVLVSAVSMLPLVVAVFMALGSVSGDIREEEILRILEQSLTTLVPAAIISIVLAIAVGAFFQAGAIGMARQAISEGKAKTGTMWSEGRRHFMNMLLATIITGLISMAGLVFLAPGIADIPVSILTNPDAASSLDQMTIGLLAGGAILFIIYSVILSLLLSLTFYALVVDGLGPLPAIKASMSFFMYNKFDVFLMWLVIIAISVGMQLIGSSAAGAENSIIPAVWSVVTSMISLLVLAPLYTVWWTRLYMTRRGLVDETVRKPW